MYVFNAKCMNEDIQDKAKALCKALEQQLNVKFHTMLFAGITAKGGISMGFHPFDADKVYPVDLIEYGNYVVTLGIKLGYNRGGESGNGRSKRKVR